MKKYTLNNVDITNKIAIIDYVREALKRVGCISEAHDFVRETLKCEDINDVIEKALYMLDEANGRNYYEPDDF